MGGWEVTGAVGAFSESPVATICWQWLMYLSFVLTPSVRRALCVQIALPCFRPWLGRLREAMKSMRCHPEAMTRLLHIIVDKSKSHKKPRNDGRQKCHVTHVSKNDLLTLGHFVTQDSENATTNVSCLTFATSCENKCVTK